MIWFQLDDNCYINLSQYRRFEIQSDDFSSYILAIRNDGGEEQLKPFLWNCSRVSNEQRVKGLNSLESLLRSMIEFSKLQIDAY